MTHSATKFGALAALLASLAATPALAQDEGVGDWLEDGEGVPTQDEIGEIGEIDSPGFGDTGVGDEREAPGEETLDNETPLGEGQSAVPGSGGDGAFDEPEFEDAGDSLGDVEVFDDDVRDTELYGDDDGPLDGGVGNDGGLMNDGGVGANGLDNL